MSYCHEKGIPHSAFLSWDPEDRAKTLAFSLESSERCSLCGTAEWEWQENKFAYEAQERFCRGCYIRNTGSETVKTALPGTTVELVKVSPEMRAQQILQERKWRKMSMGD